MSNDPENLVLVYLRRLDQRMERIEETLTDMLSRMNDHGRSLVALHRDQVGDAETTAHLAARFDRLNERVNRIEKRLDLSET